MKKHNSSIVFLLVFLSFPLICEENINHEIFGLGFSIGQRGGMKSAGLDVTSPSIKILNAGTALRIGADYQLIESTINGETLISGTGVYSVRGGFLVFRKIQDYIKVYVETGSMYICNSEKLTSPTTPLLGWYGHTGVELFFSRQSAFFAEIGTADMLTGKATRFAGNPTVYTGLTCSSGGRLYF